MTLLINDMYIHIIKYAKISQYKTLKNINRFFRYYSKQFIIIKVFKKHLKNIRFNLLYKFHFPNLYYLLSNIEVNIITYNDIINKNINKISLPSIMIHEQNIIYIQNYYEIYINHIGDILQSFTIIGKNIKKVELYIGNQLIWKSWYINAKLINISPLINGIFIICLKYSTIKIKVYADKCKKVYGYYKFLPTDIRHYFIQNNHIIPHILYNTNTISKNIIYSNGILILN